MAVRKRKPAPRKRKTVGAIRAAAVEAARNDMIAEVCQVLKWHCGHVRIAEQLFAAMHSGEKLRRGPYYDGPAVAGGWVTVPPLTEAQP